MTKSPFLNAFSAMLYIVIVASVMYYVPKFTAQVDGPIVPVTVLSLFVLSAAVMGFIFLYQPVRLYFDNQKAEAVSILLKTIGIFAFITVSLVLGLLVLPAFL